MGLSLFWSLLVLKNHPRHNYVFQKNLILDSPIHYVLSRSYWTKILKSGLYKAIFYPSYMWDWTIKFIPKEIVSSKMGKTPSLFKIFNIVWKYSFFRCFIKITCGTITVSSFLKALENYFYLNIRRFKVKPCGRLHIYSKPTRNAWGVFQVFSLKSNDLTYAICTFSGKGFFQLRRAWMNVKK